MEGLELCFWLGVSQHLVRVESDVAKSSVQQYCWDRIRIGGREITSWKVGKKHWIQRMK